MKLIILTFLLSFFYLSQGFAQKRLTEITTIHKEDRNIGNKAWIELESSEGESVKELIRLLSKSETGLQILNKAEKKAQNTGQTLLDVILPGEGSLTDTTLIRRFVPDDPTEMSYETRSKVYVNRRLRVIDAVLDLAHELTHYSYRTPFNPYDNNFTLKGFVKSTVEGTGGEVEAFLIECQVLQELYPQEADKRSNCQKVIDPETGTLSKSQGIEHFYRVGAHMRSFESDMGDYALQTNDFPHLSQDEADFISSAWGLPYPVAAFREYVTIMGKACKNDEKRLSLLKNRLARSPASFENSKSFQKMRSDFNGRCRDFQAQL